MLQTPHFFHSSFHRWKYFPLLLCFLCFSYSHPRFNSENFTSDHPIRSTATFPVKQERLFLKFRIVKDRKLFFSNMMKIQVSCFVKLIICNALWFRIDRKTLRRQFPKYCQKKSEAKLGRGMEGKYF